MSGNEVRIVVTDRDRRLLRELVEARVIDREQAAEISGRRSATIRATNYRLLTLTRAGLLNRFFIGTRAGGIKALYSISAKGAALVGAQARPLQRTRDSVLVGDQFVHHQLMVNAVLIQVKYRPIPVEGVQFVRWISFSGALSNSIALIPDGYFQLESLTGMHSMFLEVDRGTEPQKTWSKKVGLYLQLATSGEFERMFQQQRFRVLVVAESERRLLQIRRTVAQQVQKVFWFSTLDVINRDGLFAAHWLRPVGDERQSLL